ncbi:ribokinase-like isoform X1 [Ornithodoros turicata]|uniref:ribokinase-like isoform X1 n=1 Tax=Ornithodoros turicata TaxID=34597 RepID=UPI00313A46EC
MADSKALEAVFIGACVVDLISYADRFPQPGETLIGNDFVMGHGGKGANACVMATRMGLHCGMIAKVGSDKIGRDYLAYLKDIGVNTVHVKPTEEKTTNATANIVVARTGQNSIVYVPGAAAYLTPDDVKLAENLIKKAKILVAVYECSKATLFEALRTARKHKVTTFVNAAPHDPAMTDDIYKLVDILCVNETEAGHATGLEVNNRETVERAAQMLLKKGCSTVIITMGADGAGYITNDKPTMFFVPTDRVEVEDTTGAGDAFNGAFAFHYVRHPDAPLCEMVKKACGIATITVQSPGTQISYPEEFGDHMEQLGTSRKEEL